MVRRDWCPLSKDVGNFALREILSAKPKEDVVIAIHDHLNKVHCCPAKLGLPTSYDSAIPHTLAGLLGLHQVCSRPPDH